MHTFTDWWKHQTKLITVFNQTIITRITSEEAFQSHAGHTECEDEEMSEGGNFQFHILYYETDSLLYFLIVTVVYVL